MFDVQYVWLTNTRHPRRPNELLWQASKLSRGGRAAGMPAGTKPRRAQQGCAATTPPRMAQGRDGPTTESLSHSYAYLSAALCVRTDNVLAGSRAVSSTAVALANGSRDSCTFDPTHRRIPY